MKKVVLLLMLIASLQAFSLDGMIDSISNKVSDSIGDKVSKSIDNYEDTDDTNSGSSVDQDKFKKLKELVIMREKGYLTKEEYQEEKKKLLSK